MMCNFRKQNIFFKITIFQFQLFCDALPVWKMQGKIQKPADVFLIFNALVLFKCLWRNN